MLLSPPMDISDGLLALAGAIGPDGGRAVGQTLRALLQAAAPFDAAEAVLRRPEGWAHCRLDEGGAQIAGEDLLDHVVRLRAPLRLDELPEAAAFPETHRRLSALNLRSLLAIPFSAGTDPEGGELSGDPAARGPQGAVILARRFGWAFAGTSLHYLWPVAGLAGRAFELAVALTALTDRTESLEAEVARLTADPQAQEAERQGLRLELERARVDSAEAWRAVDSARAAGAEAASRAFDLEGLLGHAAAERDALRDEVARTAGELEAERGRGRELAGRLAEVLGRVAELEAALGEGRSRADALRAEAEHVRGEAEALRAEVAGLRSDAEAAREQLEARGREAAEAHRAREAAQTDLEARVREAQTVRKSAEEEATHWRAEADRLQERLAAAQADHDAHVRTLREELEAAHRAASDKGEALVAAEERCRGLEARLAAARARRRKSEEAGRTGGEAGPARRP